MSHNSDQGQKFASRSPTSVTVDNVIRRSLRVADPTDPGQIAKALLNRFEGDAESLRRERAGLTGLVRSAAPAPVIIAGGSEKREAEEARQDLDRDLTALINESQLKDIQPEMRGWSSAIRSAATNGLAAARLALDSGERDRAFAARRILTDYARLARYLAAMTGCVPGLFCRLAQSCDNMGALILVSAGEALAASGVTSTSIILQSAASELQVRRESVLAALRNLQASAQETLSQSEWPRGLTALRQLHQALEANGATDLRAYLDEGYLANIFDEMIALASGRTGDGMRALGATSVVTTSQLERFLRVAQNLASPESPPLTNFLAAIQYFIDGFGAARSGHRLVFIARPPLLFYGLYGASRPDDVTRLLLELIDHRGRFAEALDCFCCCTCEEDSARAMVIGSKALYDIDRAIDVLAQAPAGLSRSLLTAAAFEFVIRAAHDDLAQLNGTDVAPVSLIEPLRDITTDANRFRRNAAAIPAFDASIESHRDAARSVHSILCTQRQAEETWATLVRNMSSKCNHRLLGVGGENVVRELLDESIIRLERTTGMNFDPCPPLDITIPRHLEVALEDFVANTKSTGRS